MASATLANERAPLLDNEHRDQRSSDADQRTWRLSSITIPFRLNVKNSTLIPVLGMLTVFLNESEFYLKSAAVIRAIESMACFEYYSDHNDPLASLGKKISETMCKNSAIQERVASLYGASYAVRMICAVTGTTIIVSFLSSGRRRPIMVVHKVNLLLTQALTFIGYYGYPKIPIWLICFNGIFALIGANFDLGISTIFASYADVIPDPNRRSTLIFVTSSLQYGSQAICLPIASRLINLDGQGTTPEVAMWASCGCAIAVFLINWLLWPETAHLSKAGPNTPHLEGDNNKVQTSTSSEDASSQTTVTDERSTARPFQVLKEDFGLLKMAFLVLAMLCSVAASRMVDWYGLMQYPSVKFHWTLSKTMLLVTVLAILSFFTYCVLLPLFNRLCTRTLHLSPRVSSIFLSGASSSIFVTACVLMGLPTTTITMFIGASLLYTLGSGINSAIHAYTANVAGDSRASGAALTVLSLGATAGKVLTSIFWPVLLTTGLEADGGSGKWAGLPFLVAAAMAFVSTCALVTAEWIVRRNRGNKGKISTLDD